GTTTEVDGSTLFSPIFSGFLNYKVTEKLGVGAGIYVSGGTKSKFENVSFAGSSFAPAGITAADTANFTLAPTIEADLEVLEYSIGAGYEILDGLRIGGAWRIMHVGATLQSASLSRVAALGNAVALTTARLENLTDTAYNGWRVGIQYAPKSNKWGLGAT